MLCFKTVVEQKIVRPGVGENKKLNGKQLRDRYGLTSDTAEKFDEVHHQIQMNVPRSKFILSRLQTLIKEGKLDFKMLRRDNNNRISSYFKTLFYSRTLGGSVGRRSGGRSADARGVVFGLHSISTAFPHQLLRPDQVKAARTTLPEVTVAQSV